MKICNHDSCTNNVFGGGFCLRHQYMRSDGKGSKGTRASSKPIRQVSKKQASKNNEYSKIREDYIKEHPLCNAKLCGCSTMATDVHHMRGRGPYLLDTSTWIALCRECHKYVEEHPEEAKKLGLSQNRLT